MSAIELLKKAIEFDVSGRRLEALKLYQSGISELLIQCKGMSFSGIYLYFYLKILLKPMWCTDESDSEKKKHYQTKIEQYMGRAEQLKSMLSDVKSRGHVVDKICIMEGDSGYGYDRIFAKYLDSNVTEITLEEPYIREHYQVKKLFIF